MKLHLYLYLHELNMESPASQATALTHTCTEMASSIAPALSQQLLLLHLQVLPSISLPQHHLHGRVVELRSKYIQQLRELHSLLEGSTEWAGVCRRGVNFSASEGIEPRVLVAQLSLYVQCIIICMCCDNYIYIYIPPLFPIMLTLSFWQVWHDCFLPVAVIKVGNFIKSIKKWRAEIYEDQWQTSGQ